MRKLLLMSVAAVLYFTVHVAAQDFKPTLETTVKSFFEGKEATEKQSQSNRLVLIAKKFNTEWSASYYAALSRVMLSYDEQDASKKDAYLDEADEYLGTAIALSDKDNAHLQSEMHALTAMI